MCYWALQVLYLLKTKLIVKALFSNQHSYTRSKLWPGMFSKDWLRIGGFLTAAGSCSPGYSFLTRFWVASPPHRWAVSVYRLYLFYLAIEKSIVTCSTSMRSIFCYCRSDSFKVEQNSKNQLLKGIKLSFSKSYQTACARQHVLCII